MPSDSDDAKQALSPVEKMSDALDEIQAAMDRLAAERRTAERRDAHDQVTLAEPSSQTERPALTKPPI
jgi:hypothetical protein